MTTSSILAPNPRAFKKEEYPIEENWACTTGLLLSLLKCAACQMQPGGRLRPRLFVTKSKPSNKSRFSNHVRTQTFERTDSASDF